MIPPQSLRLQARDKTRISLQAEWNIDVTVLLVVLTNSLVGLEITPGIKQMLFEV